VDECDALRVKKVALNNKPSSKGKVRNRPGLKVAREHRPDITVIGQTRKGKGNALACGFDRATGDFIVMLDADGSSDPAEIPRFVDALRQGADFAKGSRFMPGAGTMLWGNGFEVETPVNVRVAKARVRVFEVPRFERNRVFGTGNLNAFSDGLRVLRTIHTERTRAPDGPQPWTRPRSDRRNPGTTRRRAHDGVTRCL
jgi:glycosyltransferase involved in cell wall biosynthesis